jgi:hypothetical protein
LSSGFQRITEYITPGYFNEEPGISPPYISMKNWVYHPWKFQRRTEYITPEYFKEEPGISPFGYFNEDRVYHPRICQRRTVYVPPKQLTGDNPVKNRQTRRQPWKKK